MGRYSSEARVEKKLKANALWGLKPGIHHDGSGLYFRRGKNAGSWCYRWMENGRQREMGLGSWPGVSLAEARRLAAAARGVRAAGGDPIASRHAEIARTRTFEDAAREYWKIHCQALARPGNWLGGMDRNIFPDVGRIPVEQLTAVDLVKPFKPIWHLEKARKLRQWVGAVMQYAAHDAPGVDLNIMTKLDAKLGKQRVSYEHHPALHWNRIPNLWLALPDSAMGLSLRLVILTATRLGAVRLARWEEIDWTEKIWKIPPEKGRLKNWKHPFRVPLTRPAIDILKRAIQVCPDSPFIFPNVTGRKPLSENTHRKWLQDNGWKDREKRPITVHGFRSSFRDWAEDEARADSVIAEHCLQHITAKGSMTTKAYLRTDQLDRRRELLDKWAGFIVGRVAEIQADPRKARPDWNAKPKQQLDITDFVRDDYVPD